MTPRTPPPRRRWIAAAVGLLATAAIFAVTLTTCSSSSGSDGEEPLPVVRIVYVVESSWFATTPEMIEENLNKIGSQMISCASSAEQTCQVMMYAVQGAEVSAKRVPSTLEPVDKLGFWYSLDTDIAEDHEEARRSAIQNNVSAYLDQVRKEIVPGSYEDQPKGCVNLVDNVASAMRALGRTPGDVNVVEIHASGLSNCKNQPFYPDKPFPSADAAAASIVKEIPSGSAEIPGRSPVCVQWMPMFGMGVTAKGAYISQEQKQVLKDAWVQVMDAWGAVQGNEPGEQQGDCLTMEANGS